MVPVFTSQFFPLPLLFSLSLYPLSLATTDAVSTAIKLQLIVACLSPSISILHSHLDISLLTYLMSVTGQGAIPNPRRTKSNARKTSEPKPQFRRGELRRHYDYGRAVENERGAQRAPPTSKTNIFYPSTADNFYTIYMMLWFLQNMEPAY